MFGSKKKKEVKELRDRIRRIETEIYSLLDMNFELQTSHRPVIFEEDSEEEILRKNEMNRLISEMDANIYKMKSIVISQVATSEKSNDPFTLQLLLDGLESYVIKLSEPLGIYQGDEC